MDRAPFGSWQSPITASIATGKTLTFSGVVLEDNAIYWSEMRPFEEGRSVIVKCSKEGEVDILPAQYNARTRVHEYGGASFTVHRDIIYFSNFKDQRLYRLIPSEEPQVITKENYRFAQMQMSDFGLVAIAESHENEGQVENFLALIDPHTGKITKLAEGHDFYASFSISQDNQKIAFIAWDHPNMPWDNTKLYVADFSEEGLSNCIEVDKEIAQSFFQPTFGPQGELIVASDKSNWWNLYRVESEKLIPLFSVESEIGKPLWQLGASVFAFYQDGIVCAFEKEGRSQLYFYKENKLTTFNTPYDNFSEIRANQHYVVVIAGCANKPSAIIRLDNQHQMTVLKQNMTLPFDEGYLSTPQHITFPSQDRMCYAYFYPPQNKNYQGLESTLPPLIVKSHGGPTANCEATLNLEIQYWTSRGFAFVDVNYAGSSGYGRAYRQLLEGNWGIYDVQDCAAAALYLAKQGLVDENKLAITGRSAGGFTTLAALMFTDTFKVGASLYGVSDLALLTKETHKFESHYLERLIGPYPQEKEKYNARSPAHHIDKLNKPVIFFQGDEDKVVPPKQAEILYQALLEKGIKTKYCLFKGEQHGFRKAENRIAVLEETRVFFLEVL